MSNFTVGGKMNLSNTLQKIIQKLQIYKGIDKNMDRVKKWNKKDFRAEIRKS